MPDIAAARPVSGAPIESAWGQQVHDQLEGLQSGVATLAGITNTSTVTIAVTFPRPYVAPPVIALITGSVVVHPAYSNLTATGVTLTARRTDGAAGATTQPIYWIAVGTPA